MKKIAFLFPVICFVLSAIAQKASFPPTPDEDAIHGRNSNCYLVAKDHPDSNEKKEFIISIKPFIDSICSARNIPAKTILSMAILESGYGFTRIGYYANNLYGMKQFIVDSNIAYVLKGQPGEGEKVTILKSMGADRMIYNEVIRNDNRYRKFKTRKECIIYLVEFLYRKYNKVVLAYQKDIRNGMNVNEAALRFAYNLAENHYCHLGGKVYRKKIESVFKTLK